MQPGLAFALGILGAAMVAAEDPPRPQPVAQWTLTNAKRTRGEDGGVCNWSLTIRDEESGRPAETCVFAVRRTDRAPCDQVQFSNVPCSPESDWVMNGGWSDYQDFMVVVVYNVREEAKAYFGLESRALNDGAPIPKQVEPAFSTKPSAAVA